MKVLLVFGIGAMLTITFLLDEAGRRIEEEIKKGKVVTRVMKYRVIIGRISIVIFTIICSLLAMPVIGILARVICDSVVYGWHAFD